MPVNIRLVGDADEVAAHEVLLRSVLTIPEPSAGYRLAVGGLRSYMDSHGPLPTPAPAPAVSPLAAAEDAKRRRDIGGEIGALMAGAADLTAQPWAPLRRGDVVLVWLPDNGRSPAYGQTYLAVDESGPEGHAQVRQVSATGLNEDPEAPEYRLRYADHWILECDLGDGLELWQACASDGTIPEVVVGPDDTEAARRWAERFIADVEGERAVLGWTEVDGGMVPDLEPEMGLTGEATESFYDLWFEAGPSALTIIRAGRVVFGQPHREVAAR